ncbi:MAG: DUF3014 domain-containing protein [Woeseiaceae bacterium]|nr:DUF3014 domain-containing protein [Woeseiaceae bacterium]
MNKTGNVILAIVVVAVLAAIAWYYRGVADKGQVVPDEPAPVPAVVEEAPDTGPQFPVPEPPPERSGTGELVELPALDDSDAYFLLEVANTFGSPLESLLIREAVIDRLVATIDNLPRGKITDRIRPVRQLQQPFGVDTTSDGAEVLGISSYARYDAWVAQIYYADPDAVYDTYRRFYPLFQAAYERLGYPDAYFNDRLVEVIDHLLATPALAQPAVLVRPNVLYEFADPDLESLSSGQKLMLRMGPDNSATLKRLLEQFRAKLVDTSTPPD